MPIINYDNNDVVIENDQASRDLIGFLNTNKSYIDNNLNLDKPYAEWTDNEVLERIRAARREVGLGSIGVFEKSDRIRNFKHRMQDVSKLRAELDQVKNNRINYVIAANNASNNDYGQTDVKNQQLHNIALNWIPFMAQYKADNPADFNNYLSLEPSQLFHFLSEESSSTLPIMLDMLQMVEDTDMSEFAYSDNNTFINDFAKKYQKLKALADGIAIIDYIKQHNENVLQTKTSLFKGDNEESIKKTEAKCKMASEMLKDYEIRMRLVSSPYYALFAGKDFDKLTPEKINELKKGEGHEALDAYLDDVVAYKTLKTQTASYKMVDTHEKETTYITEIGDVAKKDLRPKSEQLLEKLENNFRDMFNDNRRASRYNSVKETLTNYYNDDNPETKKTKMVNVINAAAKYLEERSDSSYENRKQRCEEVIELYNQYVQELYYEAVASKEKQDAEAKKAEEAQQIHAERESEFQTIFNTARKGGIKYVNDRNADEEKKEQMIREERERKAAEEKAYNEFFDDLNKVIEKFDALGHKGKTPEDAANLRKDVLAFLNEHIFKDDKKLNDDYDNDHLEFVPTKMIIDSLKEHMFDADKGTYEKDKYIKLIKDSISIKIWDNVASNEDLRQPISNFMNKNPEDVTELDKLNAYEYSLHIIEFISETAIDYNSLKFIDLKKLGELTTHLLDFNATDIDASKDEVFDDLPKETQEKHRLQSIELLSILSGKSPEIFKFLTLADSNKSVHTLIDNLTNKDEFEKTLNECEKRALAIKDRYDSLSDAIKTADKQKLRDLISKYSKIKQEEFDEIPKADLIEVAKDMLQHVQSEKNIEKHGKDGIKKLQDRSEDYYREKYLDLETKRSAGKVADQPEERKEFGYAYVKKVLGLKVMPLESLNKLDDDSLYKLVSNLGVIKYYDGKDITAKDLEKAADGLNSLQLGDDIKAAIKNTFGDKIPEEKVPLFNSEFDKDIDEHYVMDLANDNNKGMYGRANYGEIIEAKKKYKERVTEKKIAEIEKPKNWSNESKLLLDVIGDLFLVAGSDPMNAKQLARVVDMNPSIFANCINFMNKKLPTDMFETLKKGLSPVEQMFVDGARPVIESISKFFNDAIIASRNGEIKGVTYDDIRNVLKTQKINIDFKNASQKLNKVAEAAESEIIRLMHEATDDCFDQIGGSGFPNLFDEKESVKNDKETLAFIHNGMRYNKDYGQGKFLQTLMNDYYKNAHPADRRNMLSFIIKGIKNGDKSNEKQVGGEYFASSMKGAGPLMQKMMQGVPEFIVVPEIRGAINVVKSDLCHISNSHVNKVFKEIKENSGKNIKKITLNDRLGAASVAETFSCTVVDKKNNVNEVVVKILRPDAKAHMERELNFIKKAAIVADLSPKQEKTFWNEYKGDLPKHTPRATEAGFLAQLSEIEKEFNFKNEAKNIELGQEKYQKKDDKVKSVALYENIPSSENYLVMTKAEGITLDRHINNIRNVYENALVPFEVKKGAQFKIHEVNLSNIAKLSSYYHTLDYNIELTLKYGNMIKKVAEVWTTEALYGSAWSIFNNYNFRHGDLHSGNIMVGDKFATILDYGNASELHHEKVTIIMKMMSAVVLNKPEWFVEAFEEFLKKSIAEDSDGPGHIGYSELKPKVREEYIKRVTQIFATGTPESSGIKILLALTTAQNLGIKLPIELQNFSQCQQRLENSMAEVRNGAIELRKTIERLERLPIEESIKNSFDPLIVMQREMNRRVDPDSEEYAHQNSYSCASNLLEQCHRNVLDERIEKLTELKLSFGKGANVDKQLEAVKKKYYPLYETLGEAFIGGKDIRIEDLPKKTQEFRAHFNELKRQNVSFKDIDKKTRTAISNISGFFKLNAMNTGLTTEYSSIDEITKLNDLAFQHPYDEAAFDKLMAIFDADVRSIAENAKIMDYNVKHEKLNKEQIEELNNGYIDSKNAIDISRLRSSSLLKEFTKTIKNSSLDEEFDRGMERIYNEYPNYKKDIQEYRKYRDMYNNYKVGDGYQNLVEARRKMIKLENSILIDYKNLCKNEFSAIAKQTKDSRSLEQIMNSSLIPEYVDVIGKIMVDNKFSTYKRLDDKYTDEFKKLEAKENAENAAEQAKENGNEIKEANKGKAKGNAKGKDAVNSAPKKGK